IKRDSRFEKWQKDSWVPLDIKTLDQLLNLDYNVFCKAVMLPQGKFAEFLQGAPGERRAILRELCGLDILKKMQEQAGQRYTAAQQQQETLAEVITNLDAPSPQDLQTQQNELEALTNALPQYRQAAADATQLFESETQLFAQCQQFETLTTEKEALTTQADRIADINRDLVRSRQADRIRGDWENLQQTRQNLTELQEQIDTVSTEFIAAQASYETQQTHYAEFQTQATEIEAQLEAQARKLETAQRLEPEIDKAQVEETQAQIQQQRKQTELQQLQTDQAFLAQTLATLETQITETQARLVQLQPNPQRLAALDTAQTLLPQWELLEQQLDGIMTRLRSQTQARQEFSGQQSELSTQLAQATAVLAQRQTDLKQAIAENQQREQLNRAAVIRAELSPGDTCPVCGGSISAHFSGESVDLLDLQPLETLETEAQSTSDHIKTSLIKVTADLENLDKQTEAQKAELTDRRREFQQVDAQLADCLQQDSWEKTQLAKERQTLIKQTELVQTLTAQQKEYVLTQEHNQDRFATNQQRCVNLEQEAQDAQAAYQRRQQEIQTLAHAFAEITEGRNLSDLIQTLADEREKLDSANREAQTTLQTVEKNCDRLRTTQTQLNAQLQALSTQQQQQTTAWDTALSTSQLTLAEFKTALVPLAQQQSWEAEIAQYTQALTRLDSQLDALKIQIGDRKTDAEQVAARERAKTDAIESVEIRQKAKLELEAAVQAAAKNLAKAKEFATQLKTAEEQTEVYGALRNHLKSDHFQAYLLTKLEEELVARATLILKDLSDQRYQLHVEKNEYYVADNWNGGEHRRIKTLSGGETFTASLAMALALSEKLSQGTELGSLFIDEGFGTLDPETLEAAAIALETLRQQDRLIGIITHIPYIVERMPTQIEIQKSAAEGSLIAVS
ncbi:MAG: SMC family ATPase, partial [Cyanobacteria bacterium P01_H01_bin.15]